MKKFLIWFQHRSGSTHLVSLLNSHPEIRCKGEMFGCIPLGKQLDPSGNRRLESGEYACGNDLFRRVLNQFPGRLENPTTHQCLQALDKLWDGQTATKPIIGFKLKFPSQASVFPEVSQHLKSQHQHLRLIALQRKNYLRRALSVLNLPRVQAATQQANSREAIQLPPMVFDVDEILRLIRYYQEIEEDFAQWTKDFEHVLEVEYQDLVHQPESTVAGIQNFLEVSTPKPMKSKIKKVGTEDIPQTVANYSELRDRLTQDGLQNFLD